MVDVTVTHEHVAAVVAEAEMLAWLAGGPLVAFGTAEYYGTVMGIAVDPWDLDCIIQTLRHDGVVKAPYAGRPGDGSLNAYLLLELR